MASRGETARRSVGLATMLRFFGGACDLLHAPGWEPHTRGVIQPLVYASMWPAGAGSSASALGLRTLWTLVNRAGRDVGGQQLSVRPEPTSRFYDCYRGVELKMMPAPSMPPSAVLSFEIEAEGFGCVVETDGAASPELAAPPRGARSAAAETLNAAAEAAELLEELKGGTRVSVEHQRALQDLRARAYANANAADVSPRARGDVWRKGGGGPGPGPPGGFDPQNVDRQSAHARGMSYGRQLAGRAPNVGYANRAEAARERLESSHYGPANAQIPHNPHRPQDRLRSPYLDPHSASARSRRASVNAGHQWATPALQRARRHVASRGGEAEVESFNSPRANNPAAGRWNAAVDFARKEYVADKRAAAERRRARMASEEAMPMA